jgi:hypothetical protein
MLAAGVLPSEHVHYQANEIAPLVHAHFESNHQGPESDRRGDPRKRSVSGTSHDHDETAVDLGQAASPSQTVRSDYAPLVLPDTVPLLGLGAPHALLSASCIERALSPPSRQSVPRAPPV